MATQIDEIFIPQMQPPGRRILALAGSLRRNGYNRRLLESAASCAPPGLHTDIYDCLAGVPLFDEDLEASTHGGPDGVRCLRAAIASADGLVIATPEYNQSIPGVLKNTIDWLSRAAPEEVLFGKPTAIMGATPGRWGTRLAQAALRQTLTATGAVVMPAPMLFIATADSLFSPEGDLRDAATLTSLRAFMNSFADWLEQNGARYAHTIA